MKRISFALIGIFCTLLVNGQGVKFEHFKLQDRKLGIFEIHVTANPKNEKKPLLIYIDGSGNYPLFYQTKSGSTSTTIALDIKKYANAYTIVFISKPGIPFKDKISYTESGRSFYPENDTYREMYSLDWRAGAASAAIDFLWKKTPVERKRIVVMGYSEGAQVAPKVAVMNKKVTHVVCFVGNSQNQLYDFLIEARLKVERNELKADEGQYIVDSLYRAYEKIYASPNSTNKKWYDETYLKWSSFTKVSPLENMLKLSIPILYVAGGRDNNQNIINMDYAKLEFLRQGKKNLDYKVYPNCNHYFQEKRMVDGKEVKVDRSDEVNQFAFDWLGSK